MAVRVGRSVDRGHPTVAARTIGWSTVPEKRPRRRGSPPRLLTSLLPAGVLATLLVGCGGAGPAPAALTIRNQSTEPVRVTWTGTAPGTVVVDACADTVVELAPGAYVLELRTVAGLGRLPLTVETTRAATIGIEAAGQVGLGRPADNETCRNA